MESKLRHALRQGLETPVAARQAGTLGAVPPQQVHGMQELQARNHELEEQVIQERDVYSLIIYVVVVGWASEGVVEKMEIDWGEGEDG